MTMSYISELFLDTLLVESSIASEIIMDGKREMDDYYTEARRNVQNSVPFQFKQLISAKARLPLTTGMEIAEIKSYEQFVKALKRNYRSRCNKDGNPELCKQQIESYIAGLERHIDQKNNSLETMGS